MLEFIDERYESKEITLIEYNKEDQMLERVKEWILDNYPDYDPSKGERLEIKIVVRVRE